MNLKDHIKKNIFLWTIGLFIISFILLFFVSKELIFWLFCFVIFVLPPLLLLVGGILYLLGILSSKLKDRNFVQIGTSCISFGLGIVITFVGFVKWFYDS